MVKKFNQFTNEGLVKDNMVGKPIEMAEELISKYDTKKERIKELLEELLEEYDDFTKIISSRHWSSAGRYYMHMKNLLNEIDTYEKTTVDKFINAAPYM